MNLIQRIEHWGALHNPPYLAYLRIALGVYLFAKGYLFITNTDMLGDLIIKTEFQLSIWTAVHYVAFTHLVGGPLIMFGLVTRVAIAFQFPILIGAIFFVNFTNGVPYFNSEMLHSVVVFSLLIYFFILGSGKFSLDHYLAKSV